MIFPPQIKPEYQGRMTGIRTHIQDGRGTFVIQLKAVEPCPNEIVKWDTSVTLSAGPQILEFTFPDTLKEIQLLNWMVTGNAGDFAVVEKIELLAELPALALPQRAFFWSYAMLLANWDPVSGLTRDRGSFKANDFDNVSASGVQTAAAVMAWHLGFITEASARDIVERTANALLALPCCHGLKPHFVKDKHIIIDGTEWSSIDTIIALIALIEAQQALSMPTSSTEAMLKSIQWDSLLVENKNISHGYITDCSRHIGEPGKPKAIWKDFGTESWLANLGYAAATGDTAVFDHNSPTADGSGFIDELAWLLVPPPQEDRWRTKWCEYRQQAVGQQLSYYQNHPCYGPPKLFGLSAAEVPDLSLVDRTYEAFGVGGKMLPNDGTSAFGHAVITPHYAALSASLRPSESLVVWQWLEQKGLFTPLNNVESLMFVDEPRCQEIVWNALKGSWNLSLQTLGWGRYLAMNNNPLYQAVWANETLRNGWEKLVCSTVPCAPELCSESIQCDEGPSNSPDSVTFDLDDDAKSWGVYCENSPTWLKENVATPSKDGNALRCAITDGQAYSNVHFYRNLSPDSAACRFTLNLCFYFEPKTSCNNQGQSSIMQALEFSMSKWWKTKRYELALQWQNVSQTNGDGAPQWRYWDPHGPVFPVDQRWAPFDPSIPACLNAEQWHTLTLKGEIRNDQIHYVEFIIDQQSHLIDKTVAPKIEKGEPDRLAVAIQLDGNLEQSPYDVYIDQVDFIREPDNCTGTVVQGPPCSPPTGMIIDPMEQVGQWKIVIGQGAASASLTSVPGYRGHAVQLSYDLKDTTAEAWAQLRRDFDPPLDLSNGDHLRLYYTGTKKNSLEIGLTDINGNNYFATSWGKTTHVSWFTYATWGFRDFHNGGQQFPDLKHVKAIFISVARSHDADVGGQGTLTVDELQYVNIAQRPVPSSFEEITVDRTRLENAAAWIASQQQPSGLLKSWREEPDDLAWLYDQALGLIAFSEKKSEAAKKLAGKLQQLQNAAGWWHAGYHYTNSQPADTNRAVGAIAWTVYALTRYYSYSNDAAALAAAVKGAQWLSTLQRPDGSLPALPQEISWPNAPTEPNLDAWWAFRATGFQNEADRLRDYLLGQVWEAQMGRFKASRDSYQIFLDNQTWGAAFLKAVGREQEARRALSYAQCTLVTHAHSDTTICGFDGAGPFSVWNEGTLQYISQRGKDSQYYWEQMAKQQTPEGCLPGSPDGFEGYIVWLTRMHGIAPTAWFYFAGTGGPFDASPPNAVEERGANPATFKLEQNAPNPFNPSTRIRFSLAHACFVTLKIFNLKGEEVAALTAAQLPAGNHQTHWNASGFSSGVYFYQLRTKEFVQTKKLILIR
jgi:hypothetical protein